ncbi:hypothetical protein [Pseudoduganella albidiflava]|uniref:Uncharacterized protein n=1 Tax=Pseudoduganella albidiflava TaxID=321983 RepID=A0A411WS85_9BURK|nr:hypothetical protein [Pseudoduganella albidiflava]QBH99645.1 hypothetical protein EYF70_01395 [Pseudoduganella albidiflava]GGY46511.1 hypothetical protein GCM10007387_30810 [Pseudoduganella albidiflava]
MPGLVEHIDAIARREQRAVLYLEFHPRPRAEWRHYRFEDDATRAAILAWLDAHGVPWTRCGPFADPRVMAPYLGQVYLHIPYDESLAGYRVLRDYLEHPDGSMRHAGVRFYAMPLEHAMNNAEHDEPGFWERWAEGF